MSCGQRKENLPRGWETFSPGESKNSGIPLVYHSSSTFFINNLNLLRRMETLIYRVVIVFIDRKQNPKALSLLDLVEPKSKEVEGKLL